MPPTDTTRSSMSLMHNNIRGLWSPANAAGTVAISPATTGSPPNMMEEETTLNLDDLQKDRLVPVRINTSQLATVIHVYESALRRSKSWALYIDWPNHPIFPRPQDMYITVDANYHIYIPPAEFIAYAKRLFHFLSTNEFSIAGLGSSTARDLAFALARFYLLATKLEIPSLIPVVLGQLEFWANQLKPGEILDTAVVVYNNLDTVVLEFRGWFVKHGRRAAQCGDEALKKQIREIIFLGGELAGDIWAIKNGEGLEHGKQLALEASKAGV